MIRDRGENVLKCRTRVYIYIYIQCTVFVFRCLPAALGRRVDAFSIWITPAMGSRHVSYSNHYKSSRYGHTFIIPPRTIYLITAKKPLARLYGRNGRRHRCTRAGDFYCVVVVVHTRKHIKG